MCHQALVEARDKGQFSLSTTWILGIELMSLLFKREQHCALDYAS